MSLLSKALQDGIPNENKKHTLSFRTDSDTQWMLNELKKAITVDGGKPPSTAKILELLIKDGYLRMKRL